MIALALALIQRDTVSQGPWKVIVETRTEDEAPLKTCKPHATPKAVFARRKLESAPFLLPNPGDGWLGPVQIEGSSNSNLSPELDVDTFGNLWLASLDFSGNGVNLFWSGDDGANWNYLGTIQVSDPYYGSYAPIWDFGFKVDRRSNLLHLSLVYLVHFESDTLATPYIYDCDYGSYRIYLWWSSDSTPDARQVALQVSYSNGQPTGASIVADVPVEVREFNHVAYYSVDPYNGCFAYTWDTLWAYHPQATDVTFEREENPNYGFGIYGTLCGRYSSYQEWYFNGSSVINLSTTIDSTHDTSFVFVSRSTDGGNSWTYITNSPRFLVKPGPNAPTPLAIDAFAGDADAPAVHVVVSESDSRAYYVRSTDRGASWSAPFAVSLSGVSRQVSVAQAYGTDYVLWLTEDPGAGVRAFYSADRGANWTSYSFSDTAYGMPSVYPDGEEEANATSSQFFLTLYKGGNALFREAPVSDAGQPQSWTTPPDLDSLAINTSSSGYPAYKGLMDMDQIAFVFGGQYVPGIAWVKNNGGQGDIWFTRPAQALFSGEMERYEPEIRLLNGFGGTLLFSGPVGGKTLKIYDASGREVLRLRLKGKAVKAELEPGVYFWSIGKFRGKVVIK